MNLTEYEWKQATSIAHGRTGRDIPPIHALLMAAYMRGDMAYRAGLERGFPGIGVEFERLVSLPPKGKGR